MINWWMVFLGGGIGSLARFAMARWLVVPGAHFPWATFWTNLLSCAIIGLLAGLKTKGILHPNAQYLLITGFCGGFSTFSTFGFETLILLESGQVALALLYVLLSVCLGLVVVYLGMSAIIGF